MNKYYDRFLMNVETGELCDNHLQSEHDFVTKAGTWLKVIRITEEAYIKLNTKEESK